MRRARTARSRRAAAEPRRPASAARTPGRPRPAPREPGQQRPGQRQPQRLVPSQRGQPQHHAEPDEPPVAGPPAPRLAQDPCHEQARRQGEHRERHGRVGERAVDDQRAVGACDQPHAKRQDARPAPWKPALLGHVGREAPCQHRDQRAHEDGGHLRRPERRAEQRHGDGVDEGRQRHPDLEGGARHHERRRLVAPERVADQPVALDEVAGDRHVVGGVLRDGERDRRGRDGAHDEGEREDGAGGQPGLAPGHGSAPWRRQARRSAAGSPRGSGAAGRVPVGGLRNFHPQTTIGPGPGDRCAMLMHSNISSCEGPDRVAWGRRGLRSSVRHAPAALGRPVRVTSIAGISRNPPHTFPPVVLAHQPCPAAMLCEAQRCSRNAWSCRRSAPCGPIAALPPAVGRPRLTARPPSRLRRACSRAGSGRSRRGR